MSYSPPWYVRLHMHWPDLPWIGTWTRNYIHTIDGAEMDTWRSWLINYARRELW